MRPALSLQQAALLIDGEAYYSALEETLVRAQSQIIILGWNIDTRIQLNPLDANKRSLKQVLFEVLENRPKLKLYVLSWDFALLYSVGALLSARHPRYFRHERAYFALDSTHPFGGCHHQKLVVIDGTLAFTGGIDLCAQRWDTPSHRIKSQAPYHDVQAILEGDGARSLHKIAQERWKKATGLIIPDLEPRPQPLWPDRVQPHFKDAPLQIYQTQPPRTWRKNPPTPGVFEVLSSLKKAIRTAQKFIYIEQQYFSSPEILDEILLQLRKQSHLEILILLPLKHPGFLEKISVGWVRRRLFTELNSLLNEDPSLKLRIRIYAPCVENSPIALHSKLLIVDDHLLHLGTANFSSRSMGLDTECDLEIKAESHTHSTEITLMRNSLIAEHWGVTLHQIKALFDQTLPGESILSRLDALKKNTQSERSLINLLKENSKSILKNSLMKVIPPLPFAWDPQYPAETHSWFIQNTPDSFKRDQSRPQLNGYSKRLTFILISNLLLSHAIKNHPLQTYAKRHTQILSFILLLSNTHPDFVLAWTWTVKPSPIVAWDVYKAYLVLISLLYFSRPSKQESLLPSDIKTGAFLPSYIHYSTLMKPISQLSQSAGVMRLPFFQWIAGASLAQILRSFSLVSILSAQSPTTKGIVAAFRLSAYKWILNRMDGSSSRLPLKLTKFDDIG